MQVNRRGGNRTRRLSSDNSLVFLKEEVSAWTWADGSDNSWWSYMFSLIVCLFVCDFRIPWASVTADDVCQSDKKEKLNFFFQPTRQRRFQTCLCVHMQWGREIKHQNNTQPRLLSKLSLITVNVDYKCPKQNNIKRFIWSADLRLQAECLLMGKRLSIRVGKHWVTLESTHSHTHTHTHTNTPVPGVLEFDLSADPDCRSVFWLWLQPIRRL